MAAAQLAAESTVGVIQPDALYRLDEAGARMGWSVHALRTARRAGLKVRYVGRRAYIMGRDLIAHVETAGRDKK